MTCISCSLRIGGRCGANWTPVSFLYNSSAACLDILNLDAISACVNLSALSSPVHKWSNKYTICWRCVVRFLNSTVSMASIHLTSLLPLRRGRSAKSW